MSGEGISQYLGEFLFGLTIFVRTTFQALGILPAPCEEPLQYTVGAIDSRFGISKAEVVEALSQAEAVWETPSGKNLFEYNESAGLPVQFVYDERQQKTQAKLNLDEKLDTLNIAGSENKAKEAVARYEAAKKEYESLLSSYQREAEKYNERVKEINRKGGADSDQQKELKEEYQALQKQFQEVETAREKVNALVATTNQRIVTNRTLVETYNKEVTTFQEQYGGDGQAFDQGVYTGTDITIYQYEDAPRLLLVLAHEMGHALGIDHMEEPKALMYYLMRDQDIAMVALHEADREALASICQAPKLPWQK
jgi:hypothetical protein